MTWLPWLVEYLDRKPIMSKDECKITRTYYNQSELLDLRAIVSGISNKIYITEATCYGGGTKVDFIAAAKVFADYVLYEMEKIQKNKIALSKISVTKNGEDCVDEKLAQKEFNKKNNEEWAEYWQQMKGTSWPM